MSTAGTCASTGDRTQRVDSLRARCETKGSVRDCRLLNLTAQRVFVEGFVPTITGSEVLLRFRLPNGHQVCTNGVVRGHKFRMGFDVEFVGLSARDRDQINSIVG